MKVKTYGIQEGGQKMRIYPYFSIYEIGVTINKYIMVLRDYST